MFDSVAADLQRHGHQVEAATLSGLEPDGPLPTSDSFRELFIGAWPGSPFVTLADRLRDDAGWRVHEIPVGHNIARRDPLSLAAVLGALSPGSPGRGARTPGPDATA